jgi:hypothetical protein
LRHTDAKVIGTFQSLCEVELKQKVDHPSTPLSPGKYTLNTIRSDGYVVVTGASGGKSQPISLIKMLAAGFRRTASSRHQYHKNLLLR